MDFSKLFFWRQKELTNPEVLESISVFSAQLTEMEERLKEHQLALWRIEKRVNKFLGKENGDEAERDPAVKAALDGLKLQPKAGDATKSVW